MLWDSIINIPGEKKNSFNILTVVKKATYIIIFAKIMYTCGVKKLKKKLDKLGNRIST